MELIRKIKFQNRVNIMIITLMEDEESTYRNLQEQKEMSDLGIEAHVEKYKARLSVVRSRIKNLEELEKVGPSERFIEKPNGIPWDIPANWINMTLAEMLWCKIRNGGIKQGIEKMSMSGYIYGSEVGATVSMIFLALTFPLWVWFPMYKERQKWRDEVAGKQTAFKVSYHV